MKQETQPEEEENTDTTNNQTANRQKIISETLQGVDIKTQRILSFQNKAPAAPDNHMNPLRVVYSLKTPLSTKSGSRYIPQSPERILDAPDIINDYCI